MPTLTQEQQDVIQRCKVTIAIDPADGTFVYHIAVRRTDRGQCTRCGEYAHAIAGHIRLREHDDREEEYVRKMPRSLKWIGVHSKVNCRIIINGYPTLEEAIAWVALGYATQE